jgi:hypothetical protein
MLSDSIFWNYYIAVVIALTLAGTLQYIWFIANWLMLRVMDFARLRGCMAHQLGNWHALLAALAIMLGHCVSQGIVDSSCNEAIYNGTPILH